MTDKRTLKHHYEVIESDSKEYPIGFGWLSFNKMHDDRLKEKVTILEDRNCKPFKIKFLHKCRGHPSVK